MIGSGCGGGEGKVTWVGAVLAAGGTLVREGGTAGISMEEGGKLHPWDCMQSLAVGRAGLMI
jgi:hypothetical protein